MLIEVPLIFVLFLFVVDATYENICLFFYYFGHIANQMQIAEMGIIVIQVLGIHIEQYFFVSIIRYRY